MIDSGPLRPSISHPRQEGRRLPPWFKIRLSGSVKLAEVRRLVRTLGLHTVCDSAACPNRTECWSRGTATFLILGNACTRNCGFCNVPKGRPQDTDRGEPERVARAVKALQLDYAVITSVTRDDLEDGGAFLFAETIRSIRASMPRCLVEVLIPDFLGSRDALQAVINERPDVLNHNIETVPSLYARVRPQADYFRSIHLIAHAHECGMTTKSGLMVGLGEEKDELIAVLHDLRAAGCDLLTIGQYLRPGTQHLQVQKYYHPDEFEEMKQEALCMGFRAVFAGPLIRSSYRAGDCAAAAR
ncbi:MAG TPA: lipoyl synthase [Nitrospirota bacterium]|nr:lipoyl synthase [Nitrospirota bacterium]